MSSQDERPSLANRPRRTPRPAPDESVDPIDYKPAVDTQDRAPRQEEEPAAKATAPVANTVPPIVTKAPRGRPRREVTIPFSTRLAPDVINIIDDAVARGEEDGVIRSIVEEAIRAKYGRK